MDQTHTPEEIRIIGCLLEKESTTPDQYPLSLNALTLACNQKSNREPVMQLSEGDVQDALDSLSSKRLIREESGFGSRVVKYKHRFCNTEFSELQFTDGERAIICVLLLRGPQTPGELRTRTQRIHDFGNVQAVEQALQKLAAREDGALVVCLPREPGKRESRYMHCFGEETPENVVSAQVSQPASTGETHSLAERVVTLEQTVSEQQARIDALEAQLKDLLD